MKTLSVEDPDPQRIRNFLLDSDPELEVMDPELDLNLTKNHQKY
jgi:hypothetical protein